MYIRDDIRYEIVLIKKLESNCWCAAIEMKEKLYKGMIMAIYHSPSTSHGEYVRFLEDIMEDLIMSGDCIVIGDFNIDFSIDSFYSKKLQMINWGIKQYVNKPTRVTKDSKTIIDLIFANNKVDVQVMHKPKITEHAWLKVRMNESKVENQYREFISRNYNEFNIDEFIMFVENKIEKHQDLQVSVRAKKLIDSMVESLDIMAPRKKFRIPKNGKRKSGLRMK
jgi:hypothetical protein